MFVPVLAPDNTPLDPTRPARARRWISMGKAVGFFKQGIFCVRLINEPETRNTAKTVVGVDPGSKMEGFTVKSCHHTFINIQLHAIKHVKKRMEERRNLRRKRRQRKTPYRKPRFNNRRGIFLPPSTKARWDGKLRILNFLSKLFPITDVVVEDVSYDGNGSKIRSFTPVQKGKNYFYASVMERWNLHTFTGFETSYFRRTAGLKKSSRKLEIRFDAHCVDSWVLANKISGGHKKPDNTSLYEIRFIAHKRRNLHKQNFSKGGVRHRVGGTITFGMKRGSIIKHVRHGICLLGGFRNVRSARIKTQDLYGFITSAAKIEDIYFKAFNSFVIKKH